MTAQLLRKIELFRDLAADSDFVASKYRDDSPQGQFYRGRAHAFRSAAAMLEGFVLEPVLMGEPVSALTGEGS